MAFVLNIFRAEKKDNLGFLPKSVKPADRKAKRNDLEEIADEFMRKEEYTVQSDKYGVSLEPSANELAEDMPHEDDDDGYYTPLEKQLYQRPRPESNSVVSSPIRWQKGGVLGVGAFGKVFMGLNLNTGELIAVKQISLEGQNRREAEAVEHEVNLLRNLRHENIVQYFGTSIEDNTLNLFLEYVPGGSIASLLQKFGKFSEPVIQVYTKQLLLGLEYLHRHQIVHRDIKGANILVDNSGTIKVADFGASKTIEGLKNRNMTMSGIKGTPLWMAPEVIKQVRHGRQADIWSVGCTVIEMTTGQPPWSDFTDQVSALFHIGSSNDIPRIPEFMSAEGKDFLLSCLKRDPKKRPTAVKLLEHPFVAKMQLPSERSPTSSEASSRASYSPGLSRQLSRENIHESPKIGSLRPGKARDGSEPNSGSSTPARRLLASGGNSPRDSPSSTLRGRHTQSGSQLLSEDTCEDEPTANAAKPR